MMMSSVAPQQENPPPAARAGADLRAARERLGWDLADIAASLRIRYAYLEALEEGRIDRLPGPAYALGFLRTYAASLGLDPDEISRRFKTESGTAHTKPELAFPAPMPERGVPAGAVVLLGLALAVAAYAGWYRLSGEGRLPAETTAIPERLAPLAEQALPPASPSAPPVKVAAVAPTPAPATPAMLTPAPSSAEAAEPPAPAVSPGSAAAAVVPGPAAAGQPPARPPEAAPGSALAAAAPMPPLAAAQPHIVLRATADAWVEVRDRSGQVLLSRILHAGDTWPVPDRPNLLLTTGNAGGTELVVDGATTGLLGNPGAVRRDLPLDATLIKEGRLAPQAANGVQPASMRSVAQ